MSANHDRPGAPHADRPIQEVVAALRARLGHSLRGVVLFGSRARGEARPDSDWDLLVIADGLSPSLLERSRELRRVVPEQWRGRAAIIALTPNEFETEFPAYYLDLAVDGKILLETGDYLRKRLDLIRRRIVEAGLERRKLDHSFFWSWRTPPRGRWRIDWSGVHGLVD